MTRFELFFDLVFVFAFTQVTGFMAHAHSGLGVLQAVIILGLLWFSWASYSWLSNQTHVDEGLIRIGMIVAMIAVFIVALAIPESFEDREGGLDAPLVLAIAYFVVRLIHTLLFLVAAGDDRALRRQVLRTSIAMFTGSAFIVSGAIIGGAAQTWIWLAGLVAEIALTHVTSSAGGSWRVHSAAHWSERYALVVILALGESILAIAVGSAESPVSGPILIGAVLGIVLSIFLWWVHFDVIATFAEQALRESEGPDRTTLALQAYTYIHVVLIAGIVISALGVEEILAHAADADAYGIFGACALFGGTALYLAGHAAFWKRVSGRWPVERLALATVLVVVIPLGAVVPPLVALAILAILCGAMVAVEKLRNGSAHTTARERLSAR